MTFLHSYCLGTEQLQFRHEFLCLISVREVLIQRETIFSSPGRSPGRAIVLPLALALVLAFGFGVGVGSGVGISKM